MIGSVYRLCTQTLKGHSATLGTLIQVTRPQETFWRKQNLCTPVVRFCTAPQRWTPVQCLAQCTDMHMCIWSLTYCPYIAICYMFEVTLQSMIIAIYPGVHTGWSSMQHHCWAFLSGCGPWHDSSGVKYIVSLSKMCDCSQKPPCIFKEPAICPTVHACNASNVAGF